MEFMPGSELARRLLDEIVRPLMTQHAPGLPYAAGLLGPGSDVLGYDTARSMDHDWGPRLVVVLSDVDLPRWRDRLDRLIRDHMPPTVAGFATRFTEFAGDPGVTQMDAAGTTHRIRIVSLAELLRGLVGIDDPSAIDAAFWLTVTGQQLLELTAGPVFHDDAGDLTAVRETLEWYPDDIWRYRMAAAWKRIAQVEPFIGRAGEVGDDLGSQVIAVGLVRDVMHLAMLQQRRYAPYPKWLGTAFGRTPGASDLMPWLDRARFAPAWPAREAGIVGAIQLLAHRHNELGVTSWVDPSPRPFHERPFTVMDAERFATALTESIGDPVVRSMPTHLGGIDQFMDSTDALVSDELRQAIRAWLRGRGQVSRRAGRNDLGTC